MKSLLLFAIVAPAVCHGAVIGQMDTFTAGTQGWTVALGPGGGVHPAPPATLTGGQGGPADAYLHLTAVGGTGAGSKLTAMNISQWTGDYIVAGITGIRMDVRNASLADLSLRLVFENLGAMGPVDLAFSSVPVLLSAGSNWTSVLFPVGPSFLTATIGSAATALASTDVLRIAHSPAAEFPPSGSVVATLDIDNITATGVPEPATVLLTSAGLVLMLARVRRLSARRPTRH